MSRAACVALLCAWCARARAEPRQDPTTGRAVFTGATSPNATSLELNPAALELGTVNEVYVAGTAVLDRLAIHRRLEDIATGMLGDGPSLHATELEPGGMIAIVVHAKDRATIAAALNTTPVAWFPSGQNAIRYATLGGNERTYAGVLGASIRVIDELYFGLSIGAQDRHLNLHYARDTALASGDVSGGVENPATTEVYNVSVHSELLSTDALTYNIGLVYLFSKDTILGVAYHTPPGLAIENSLTGNVEVALAPASGGGYVHGGSTVFITQPASVDAEFRTRLPAQLDLHVGVRWEDLSRMQAYDVRTYGTALAEAGVPEWTLRPLGFHDPVGVWAGVEQADLGEAWRFGGRIGFETSSVDDARTQPMVIAPASVTLDGGVQYRVGPALVIQTTLGLQYFPSLTVTRSAYNPQDQLTCIASGYDYSTGECENVRNGYALPTMAGDYSRFEATLRIALRYVWGG